MCWVTPSLCQRQVGMSVASPFGATASEDISIIGQWPSGQAAHSHLLGGYKSFASMPTPEKNGTTAQHVATFQVNHPHPLGVLPKDPNGPLQWRLGGFAPALAFVQQRHRQLHHLATGLRCARQRLEVRQEDDGFAALVDARLPGASSVLYKMITVCNVANIKSSFLGQGDWGVSARFNYYGWPLQPNIFGTSESLGSS